eukprot:Em0205g7a
MGQRPMIMGQGDQDHGHDHGSRRQDHGHKETMIMGQGGKIMATRRPRSWVKETKIMAMIMGQVCKILYKILGKTVWEFGRNNPQHLDLGHDLGHVLGQDFFRWEVQANQPGGRQPNSQDSHTGSSGSDPAIAKLLCSMRQIQEELQVGWAVVKEYDADALADNSNDERIEKAEKAAERKVVTKLQEGKQREGGARKMWQGPAASRHLNQDSLRGAQG